MATSLEELINKLNQNNQNAYTPLTKEQIEQEAKNRYESVYGQKRLTAQQQYDTNDQALAQQLAGLQSTYDKQRDQTAENYRKTSADFDRRLTSRGMQRSSYGNASLANIGIAGNKAQKDIDDAQTQQEGNIGAQRQQLSQQLAAQLAQYDADQQNDILAYIDQLEAREYERGLNDRNTQNQLAMSIYEYQHQAEREALEDARYNSTHRRGGSYRSNSGDKDNSSNSSAYDSLIDKLREANAKKSYVGGVSGGIGGGSRLNNQYVSKR